MTGPTASVHGCVMLSLEPKKERVYTQLTLSAPPSWSKKPETVKRPVKRPKTVAEKTDIMMRYIQTLQTPPTFKSKLMQGRSEALRIEEAKVDHMRKLEVEVVLSVLENAIAFIEANEVRLPVVKLKENCSELTWHSRSVIIAYYLHPTLADQCVSLTVKLFESYATSRSKERNGLTSSRN
ncbi:hypothetical protein B5M09_011780 [Aphanomyces astaci]|uniref:Uncharacterized protein n=1 Tax=Aphanomyces astaci TaxID=112090 RepID=A0A425CWN7_APHAT|nr:hypothetical protein B5M09_011780 [Aphanomyces astaci]